MKLLLPFTVLTAKDLLLQLIAMIIRMELGVIVREGEKNIRVSSTMPSLDASRAIRYPFLLNPFLLICPTLEEGGLTI